MSLRSKLILLMLIPVVFLAAYAAFSRHSINRLTTGGLVTDKDLVADILPPPEYLIEAYLNTLQISDEANQPRLKELEEQGRQLRKDFEDRKRYWDNALPAGELKTALEESTRKGFDFLDQRDRELIPLIKAGNYKDAHALALGPLTAKYQAHRAAIDQLVTLANKQTEVDQASMDALIHSNMTLAIAGPLGVMIAVGAFGFCCIRDIAGRLQRVSKDLNHHSKEVATAASQLSSTSQSLAQGASEQASSLEETSASLEEMSSMTQRNAENSEKARLLSTQTREAAQQGVASMERLGHAMSQVKEASEHISGIIRTIDEIAFQTNILALNAAVEAARAGEAGAGFAVVAEEVRALAQRSAQAARESSSKIADSVLKSQQGYTLSEEVGSILSGMADRASQLDRLVDEIAHASKEQAQGISQVNSAVGEIDKVTQETAASTEQTASTGAQLNAQAIALRTAVLALQNLLEGSARTDIPQDQQVREPNRSAPGSSVQVPQGDLALERDLVGSAIDAE